MRPTSSSPFLPAVARHGVAVGLSVLLCGFGSAAAHADACAGLKRLSPAASEGSIPSPSSSMGQWMASQEEARVKRGGCPGYLHHLLTTFSRWPDGAAGEADRAEALRQINALLDAGVVPREAGREASWLHASWAFVNAVNAASSVLPSPEALAARQRVLRDTFEARLLPRLAGNDAGDIRLLMLQALELPEAIGLKLIARLATLRQPDPALLRDELVPAALSPRVPEATFREVARHAGPLPDAGVPLLLASIDGWSATGVRRLLSLGVDPAAAGVIERAADAQNPAVYAVLKEAVAKRGTVVPAFVDRRAPADGRASSYTCMPDLEPGMKVEGNGTHGCHFVLRDPASGRALPRTAYHLQVQQMSATNVWERNRKIALNGVTDDQGRTPHLLVGDDISLRATWIVPVKGAGPGWFEASAHDTAGEPMAGRPYRLRDCRGRTVHKGVSDPWGRLVIYKSQARCDVTAELLP